MHEEHKEKFEGLQASIDSIQQQLSGFEFVYLIRNQGQ